jgi:rod shape-determining protein MreC
MNSFNNSTIAIGLVILLLIVGIGVVNYIGIKIPYFSLLEKGVFNLLSPLFKMVTGFYNSVTSYWDGLTRSVEIAKQNKRLKRQITNLKRENLTLLKLARQNQRLRKLLSFKEFVPYETQGATVVGFGPSNWENKIIIDKGENDGLKMKMPVISYNGTLVGHIDYVGAYSSQVKLVNNSDFVIGGIVKRNNSRAIGLIKGRSNNRKENKMEKISWDADIKEGDIVLTSGLSNNYPKALPIGEVIEVSSDNYGVSQSAKIELYFSRNTIEEVLVVTDF